MELRPELDLREEMQSFYSEFAARWTMQVESTFKPIFVPPYYKSGLGRSSHQSRCRGGGSAVGPLP